MAKKITGQIKLQLPAGKANPGAAGRPRARPARREHHGLLQGVQREDRGRGHDHPRRHHGLRGPLLHVHPEDAARERAPQEGRRPRDRARSPAPARRAEQGQGRQGHREAGPRARRDEDAGHELHGHRSRDAHRPRHRPLDGNRRRREYFAGMREWFTQFDRRDLRTTAPLDAATRWEA